MALFDHTDRAVVITGGGTGIGRGMASGFVAAGARVLICGRREKPLADAAREIEGPGEIAVRTADVTREEDVEGLAEDALARWGKIDVWINNAGIMERGPLPDVDADHLQRLLDVNVKGVFLGCRAAVPRLRGRGGVILNVSSYLAARAGATAGVPAYAASKGAVSALTRSLAVRHGREGIRVNAINPALVPTGLNPEIWEGHPDRAARDRELAERYPLGRIGTPEDVAAAALFLASDEASWITGQELFVDGGLSVV